MKVNISRTLVLKSPLHLKTILDNKEELQSNQFIIEFIESVDNFLNGCQCDDTDELEIMNSQYELISNNQEYIKVLMDSIDCTNIIFNK